jgi:hypothetical protein
VAGGSTGVIWLSSGNLPSFMEPLMRKFLRATGLAMAAGAGLAACYPERASQPNDYASITTVYDTRSHWRAEVLCSRQRSLGGDTTSATYDSLIERTAATWSRPATPELSIRSPAGRPDAHPAVTVPTTTTPGLVRH